MQRCPRPDCRRAGDDLGNCGDKALPCPPYVRVDTAKDVIVHCATCNITRAIAVADIMTGNRTNIKCRADTSKCKAMCINGVMAEGTAPKRKPVAKAKKATKR